MVEWSAFEYREFYDYPRALIVEHDGARYLLDCAFDERADGYPSRYQIHRIEDASVPTGSWVGLGARAEPLGSIADSPQLFDTTRRQRIRWDFIRAVIDGQSQ